MSLNIRSSIRLALLLVLVAGSVQGQSLTALKTELTTNPTSIAGLSAAVAAGRDCEAASLLNALTTTNIFQAVPTVTFKGALDPTEFATLTSLQLSQLSVMLSGETVDAVNLNVRTILTNIFSPAGSFPVTRVNILSIVRRLGSRAEVLFGAGTVLSCDLVQKARVLP